MASCEHCWSTSGELRGISYTERLAQAEANGEACTTDTPEGAKLRAGQFWDEERQCDTRLVGKAEATSNA